MSANYNHVVIAGRLTKDPELKVVGANKRAVANLSVAVNRQYKHEGQTKEDTVFVDVEMWGQQAETAGEYLEKGCQVLVDGRLATDAWTTKEGQKRTRLKLVGDRVQFITTKKDRVDASAKKPPVAKPVAAASDDEAPF